MLNQNAATVAQHHPSPQKRLNTITRHFPALQFPALQFHALHFPALQFPALQFPALHFPALFNFPRFKPALRFPALEFSALHTSSSLLLWDLDLRDAGLDAVQDTFRTRIPLRLQLFFEVFEGLKVAKKQNKTKKQQATGDAQLKEANDHSSS